MGTFDTIQNRCRICSFNLSDLTCSIAIFGEQSATFHLQRKIEKYLQITVSFEFLRKTYVLLMSNDVISDKRKNLQTNFYAQ